MPSRPGPAASRAAGGFTVVELMVVVAILVLLMTLLAPAFTGIRAEVKAVWCQSNLGQIGKGFGQYKATYAQTYLRQSGVYPQATAWPGIPGKEMKSWDTFICPADITATSGTSGVIELHSQEGWSVPMAPGTCVKVVRGPAPAWDANTTDIPDGATEYGLEDIGGPNSTSHGDSDFNDLIVRIYDNDDQGYVVGGSAGYSNSIWGYGQLLLQVPSIFGRLNPPLVFAIPSGKTNYGYNLKVCDMGKEASIVAVDYPQIVANRAGEDILTLLNKVNTRHNGKVNVLRTDGSAYRAAISQLDPALTTGKALWGNN
ncbi:MAG: type II secretion system protein [Planctomycetota bacterium]|nr:type II secretion system protein [Planctomycetota bacterium]